MKWNKSEMKVEKGTSNKLHYGTKGAIYRKKSRQHLISNIFWYNIEDSYTFSKTKLILTHVTAEQTQFKNLILVTNRYLWI